VPITTPAGTYAIDRFEVTVGDYQAFVAAASTDHLPSECAWKTSFDPAMSTAGGPRCPGWYTNALATNALTLPMACVDWCDAFAYCAWAHKRLCGKIGGGPAALANVADPSESQWYAACSAGGELEYPYGHTYEVGTCNDASINPEAVGSRPGCEGGFAGIFDMSGNVVEWEDACDTNPLNTAQRQTCAARGGAFYSGTAPADLACASAAMIATRDSVGPGIGFRCCSR
jgi:formylglycine-generating enzyme required for sulfatase activity